MARQLVYRAMLLLLAAAACTVTAQQRNPHRLRRALYKIGQVLEVPVSDASRAEFGVNRQLKSSKNAKSSKKGKRTVGGAASKKPQATSPSMSMQVIDFGLGSMSMRL